MHEHDRIKLQRIIDDSASTAEEKALARQELKDDPDRLEDELLLAFGKPDLAAIDYRDVHQFCAERHWSGPTRDLYGRWQSIYFKSEVGRKDLGRMAEYLRKCDFDEWEGGLLEWEGSKWSRPVRLIAVLDLVADSQSRGNYHSPATVEHAKKFLAEMKRRCPVADHE